MKAKLSLNKLPMDRLTILFHTLHAINLQGQLASDYCWMSELEEVKGLNTGKVYWRSQKGYAFADATAEVQHNKVQMCLGNCKFVLLIVDGSMDSCITDNEMIYIQTCLESVTHTNVIHCCQVECGTAEGIVHAIKRATETLIDWDQCIVKLLALGSDGAAVMLGKNNDVITLFQAQQRSVIAVHCSGHSLELAYKESIKKFSLAEKLSHY